MPESSVVLRVDNFSHALRMVQAGLGIALRPAFLEDYLPELRPMTAPIEELQAPLWLITHAELNNTMRIKVLRRADCPAHLFIDIGLNQLRAPVAVIAADEPGHGDIMQQAGKHHLPRKPGIGHRQTQDLNIIDDVRDIKNSKHGPFEKFSCCHTINLGVG